MCNCCGCGGSGVNFCISNIMYSIEKIAAWLAMTAIVSCIIITVLMSIGLGIGIGYNYSFVDLKTAKLDTDSTDDSPKVPDLNKGVSFKTTSTKDLESDNTFIVPDTPEELRVGRHKQIIETTLSLKQISPESTSTLPLIPTLTISNVPSTPEKGEELSTPLETISETYTDGASDPVIPDLIDPQLVLGINPEDSTRESRRNSVRSTRIFFRQKKKKEKSTHTPQMPTVMIQGHKNLSSLITKILEQKKNITLHFVAV